MHRYLLIANQTLGGSELYREIALRIVDESCEFHVVVPMTEPEAEATWIPADPAFGMPVPRPDMSEALDEARRRSEHRLQQMLHTIEEAGGIATGEVGPMDPYEAAIEALERGSYEEVILSTLPPGISRWLKLDLPSRLKRATDLPVTVVEAEESTVNA
jgi:hypothetical protein